MDGSNGDRIPMGVFDLRINGIYWGYNPLILTFYHQKFQVPKMEVLNLIRPFWGWGFPYISLTYSLYR